MQLSTCPALPHFLLTAWLAGSFWGWVLTSYGQISPVVPLTAQRVATDTMQHLGRGQTWRFQPSQPAGWASLATDDHTWPLVSASFPFDSAPPG